MLSVSLWLIVTNSLQQSTFLNFKIRIAIKIIINKKAVHQLDVRLFKKINFNQKQKLKNTEPEALSTSKPKFELPPDGEVTEDGPEDVTL